jgi:hypothetical protein
MRRSGTVDFDAADAIACDTRLSLIKFTDPTSRAGWHLTGPVDDGTLWREKAKKVLGGSRSSSDVCLRALRRRAGVFVRGEAEIFG